MGRSNYWSNLITDQKFYLSFALSILSTFTSANPPTIDVSHNMRILKLPINTKVGSIIYRLKGTDADNDIIEFGVRGNIGKRLLSFKRVNFHEADVFLNMPLEEKGYNITIFAFDGKESTEVESTILVTEMVERIESAFLFTETTIKIFENVTKNETIGSISVKEKEDSNLPVTFELRGSDKFAIRYIFGPRGRSSAIITLVQNVDYEKQNLYVLTIVALNAWTNETVDTRNVALIDILVVILDVEDTPPVFQNIPTVVRISENIKVGTIIFTVRAEDGDYGNQRNISYEIDRNSPLNSYFAIDETFGSIVLRRRVQEIKQEIGTTEPMLLDIKAIEVTNSDENVASITSHSTIALVIVSTDNKAPRFNSEHLIGSIDENSQLMTPIRWQGKSVPQVFDDDPGLNGTLILDIIDSSNTFMIQPKKGINEITFSIVVKDAASLDYENNKEKLFTIIISATDQSLYFQQSSKIFCTIKLNDMNDNIPQFSKRIYEAFIPEDALPGLTVAKIEATDIDSGDFGKVRFTSLNGPFSNNLRIDAETGIITLLNNNEIDREVISEYRIIIEARDDLGRGNKNITELHLKIIDSNDNSPIFLQPRYDAVLNPDLLSFTQPLIVKALDSDQIETMNSNVTYEIIDGNYQNKFAINKMSGEITLKSALTFEKNFKISNKIFGDNENERFLPLLILTIRANDQGFPIRFSTVPIYIHNPDFLNRTVAFLIPDSEKNVREREDKIEEGLSSLTGAKVHIRSIQQQKDKDLTAVLAWIDYPPRSSVDLSQMPLMLSQIMGKEYKNDGQMKEVNNVQMATTDFHVLFWLLIILIFATLIFLIIFLICWFCCCKNQMKRKKSNQMSDTMISREYIKTMNGSVVKDLNSAQVNESNKSKSNRKANVSVQAWNEDIRDGRERANYRPSSAPHNEPNYMRNVRANSSQSFQDSALLNNPSMYQRFSKLNRQQRTRVVPQYYEAYDERIRNQNENDSILINDIHDDNSSLNNLRQPYYVMRSRSDQIRRMRPIDNMGYLRTSHDPFLMDEMVERNSLQPSRPVVQHLPYNDKFVTVPKRTEILYIQSPMRGNRRTEDMIRSISQNDMQFNEEYDLNISSHPNDKTHSILHRNQTEGLMADSVEKQRHISFKDQKVSDLSIPEELTVPGMVPIDSETSTRPNYNEYNTSDRHLINETNAKEKMMNEMNSNERHQNFEVSPNKRTFVSKIENKKDSSNSILKTDKDIGLKVENSLHSASDFGTSNEEQIQITSISGVPVSIELTNGDYNSSNQSTNNQLINTYSQNTNERNLLRKENSSDNSEKSDDSDSGIGRSVINTRIDFDIKNSGILEKKSIFTIAYNDVKTRQLQSAESIGE